MVLFEIWSLGEKPYGDFSNRIVSSIQYSSKALIVGSDISFLNYI